MCIQHALQEAQCALGADAGVDVVELEARVGAKVQAQVLVRFDPLQSLGVVAHLRQPRTIAGRQRPADGHGLGLGQADLQLPQEAVYLQPVQQRLEARRRARHEHNVVGEEQRAEWMR